ncbi:hypothetical protein HK101_009367 [Irineochytrium annulatum]|nr:hypothetical protein HK101_009367 [Irineochytrium annulatum]
MDNSTAANDTAEAVKNVTQSAAAAAINEFNIDFARFLSGIAGEDPVATLMELPHIAIGVVVMPMLFLYFVYLLTTGSSKAADVSSDEPFVDDAGDAKERQELERAAVALPHTNAIWQIGVSGKAVSVSEEISLRAIEITRSKKLPTADEIITAFLKAIVKPSDNGQPHRPHVAMFLSTRMIPPKTVTDVAARLKEVLGVRIDTQEALEPELPALMVARQAELAKMKTSAPPPTKPELQPMPNRACFVCKQEIKGKPRQCSACKAIIYCSPECAQKDWPQHKIMCSTYKNNMIRLADEKLHDLPFTFYNSKKQLENFNQVPFLVQNDVHNIGVYRRLCPCFQQLAWGEISGEIAAQSADLPDAEAKFKLLGLPAEMFPLGKAFDSTVKIDEITTWEAWYKAVGLPLSSPVALVFEVPLTIWYLIKEFAPVRTEKGRRKLTIHLLGPEREADLIQIYEALLPLLPNTDLILHLIGPNLSKRLRPEHTSYSFSNGSSTIHVTLNGAEYGTPHLDGSAFGSDPKTRGAAPPDLVIAMNAAVFQYQSWLPTVKLLVDRGQRTVFTEPIETTIEILAKNLIPIQASLAIKTRVNPFRQPVFQWKREVNLPGWSNGFITGLGNFSE